MHLSATAQGSAKAGLVREALRMAGPVELVPGPPLAYRNRARLRWMAGRLGTLRAGARQVVDVPSCATLAPPLAQGLAALREVLAALGPAGEARLVCAASGGAAAALSPERDPDAAFFGAIESLVREGRLRGAIVTSAGTSRAVLGDPTGEVAGGDGRPLAVDPDGFAQPCDALVPRIADALLGGLALRSDDRILELFAGAGTWTVALAPRVFAIVAVESDLRAARRLEENAAARGLANVRVRRETAESALASPGKTPTIVVLDPPRTGARAEVAAIAALRPRRVAYVSCDPATLARDVGAFGAVGYRAICVRAFDLMPQTADVETLVILDRG